MASKLDRILSRLSSLDEKMSSLEQKVSAIEESHSKMVNELKEEMALSRSEMKSVKDDILHRCSEVEKNVKFLKTSSCTMKYTKEEKTCESLDSRRMKKMSKTKLNTSWTPYWICIKSTRLSFNACTVLARRNGTYQDQL